MTTSLRCITIRQPWAGLIATGVKRVENRTRRTGCRGLIGIHAGLTLSRAAYDDPVVRPALADPEVATSTRTKGAIIAVADLVDCHQSAGCCQPWGEPDVWHLALSGIRRIEPVPAKGSLSLPWFAPPEVAVAVWGQLPDLVPQ